METTKTIGGTMQGTSINSTRRKYNLTKKKKTKKVTLRGKGNIKHIKL